MTEINQVKLATDLAERELNKYYGDDDSQWDTDEDGNEVYSNEAQDRFNHLYDEFYNMIEIAKGYIKGDCNE